jgi:hypothetical protein
MPIAYLDVPEGIQIDKKKKLVQELYDALHEAYPVPDDVRIFLREWSSDSMSHNGRLGLEPVRPVLIMQVPQGVSIDAKRKMMQGINSAVAEAYHLPELAVIMHENPPDRGSLDGRLFSDSQGRVDAQKTTASREGSDALSSDLMEAIRH